MKGPVGLLIVLSSALFCNLSVVVIDLYNRQDNLHYKVLCILTGRDRIYYIGAVRFPMHPGEKTSSWHRRKFPLPEKSDKFNRIGFHSHLAEKI